MRVVNPLFGIAKIGLRAHKYRQKTVKYGYLQIKCKMRAFKNNKMRKQFISRMNFCFKTEANEVENSGRFIRIF
jgi:hypothetical protein